MIREVPQRVFIALVEVRPRAAGLLDPALHGGAAFRCYIPARTRVAAMTLLRQALDREQVELVETEFCHDYDAPGWQREGDGTDAAGVSAARHSGEVEYGTLHRWGHDAPDAS
jgi:hypothetical protein